MKKVPNKLLLDFENGSGVFESDSLAWKMAQTMGKNQRRKLERHGLVPSAFSQYLKQSGTFDNERVVPKTPNTTFELLSILDTYSYRSEEAKSLGQYLSRKIKEADFPELKGSSGVGDHVWKGLERAQKFNTGKEKKY